MKLDARRVEAFLANPGATRVVLLHGEDEGLIREWAAQLVRGVAGSLDDAFRVSEVDRDGFSRLPDEVAAMSLTGGRRVVRVRDATDAATTHVQKLLAGNGPGLLVLEGPGLGNKSKLKTLLDRSEVSATIACYPMDARTVSQLARSVLEADRISVDSDTLSWLSGQLGADRGVTRRELEKLALFVAPGGSADIVAARACVGDLSGLSLEDALFSATDGDVAAADRALELALSEGATAVGVIRSALMHMQRLVRARTLMQDGLSAEEAVKALRPPVFFRREASFVRAMRAWGPSMLSQAAQRLWDTERACKRTGSPAETLCRNAIIGLAQRGALARRR
jgi:DNA polymerase-3 subunit delta